MASEHGNFVGVSGRLRADLGRKWWEFLVFGIDCMTLDEIIHYQHNSER